MYVMMIYRERRMLEPTRKPSSKPRPRPRKFRLLSKFSAPYLPIYLPTYMHMYVHTYRTQALKRVEELETELAKSKEAHTVSMQEVGR